MNRGEIWKRVLAQTVGEFGEHYPAVAGHQFDLTAADLKQESGGRVALSRLQAKPAPGNGIKKTIQQVAP